MSRRVLHVSNFYPPKFLGGAEIIAHRQVKALRTLGWDVAVFAGNASELTPRHSLREESWEGVPVWRLTLGDDDFRIDKQTFHKTPIDDRFSEVLDRFQPEIVHFHNMPGLSWGILSRARRSGAAVIGTLHDHSGFCLKNTLLKDNDQICSDFRHCAKCLPYVGEVGCAQLPVRLRRDYILDQVASADRLISPSHYLAGAYVRAGVPVERMRVIPYGIAVESFQQHAKTPQTKRLRVGFAAYLSRHKGLDVLIDAVEKARRRSDIDVLVAGDGYLRSQYEHEVQRRGLGGSIRFLGKINSEDIARFHENLDVLVVCSVWPENSPVTIYEALAAGTVVAASAIGGIPELISDRVNGLLFQPRNSDALANLLDMLATDRALLNRLARGAQESAKSLDIRLAAQRIVAVYDEALANARSQLDRLSVALIGRPDKLALSAVEHCDSSPRFGSVRFLRADWSDDESIQAADLIWIVDGTASPSNAIASSLKGKSVLAPDSWESKDLDGTVVRYSSAQGLFQILSNWISKRGSS